MHLWPTKTIRESWRLPHMRNLDRVISQKRAEKRSQEQKLLANGSEGNGEPVAEGSSWFGHGSKLRCIFRDLAFILTCCCCHGACVDEVDYYVNY